MFEEKKRKRLEERLRREGVKTHKERVEELNRYLSKLSEHHDMYVTADYRIFLWRLIKVGPGLDQAKLPLSTYFECLKVMLHERVWPSREATLMLRQCGHLFTIKVHMDA